MFSLPGVCTVMYYHENWEHPQTFPTKTLLNKRILQNNYDHKNLKVRAEWGWIRKHTGRIYFSGLVRKLCVLIIFREHPFCTLPHMQWVTHNKFVCEPKWTDPKMKKKQNTVSIILNVLTAGLLFVSVEFAV